MRLQPSSQSINELHEVRMSCESKVIEQTRTGIDRDRVLK